MKAKTPRAMEDELSASLGALRRKRSAFLISLDEVSADASDPSALTTNAGDVPHIVPMQAGPWKAIALAAAAGLIAGLVLGRR